MADNVTFQDTDLSTPPNTTIVATDNIGGINYQRTKLVWGVDGVATDASAAAPLPVTLATGTTTIGKIDFAPIAAQLTTAPITFAASGDNTVVAGVAAQTIKIYRLILTAAAATVVTFKSGAGTSLSGAMTLTAGGSITLDFDGEPWYTTASAAAFVINSTNAVQISGTVYSITS